MGLKRWEEALVHYKWSLNLSSFVKLLFLYTLWKLPFQISSSNSLSDSHKYNKAAEWPLKTCHNRIILFTTYSKNSQYFPNVSSLVTPSCGRWWTNRFVKYNKIFRSKPGLNETLKSGEIRLQSQGTGLWNKKGSRRNLTPLLITIFICFSCYGNSHMLGKACTTETVLAGRKSEIKALTHSDCSDSHLAGGRMPHLYPRIRERINALVCKSQTHETSAFED